MSNQPHQLMEQPEVRVEHMEGVDVVPNESAPELVIAMLARKGSAGKTTFAVQLAAFLSHFGKTRLIDGDPTNRSAKYWARKELLPFTVTDERSVVFDKERYRFTIFDTPAVPTIEDVEVFAKRAHYIIVPVEPSDLGINVNVQLIRDLEKIGAKNFKVLLSRVPNKPNQRGNIALEKFKQNNIPVFDTMIHELEAYRTAVEEGIPVYLAHHRGARAAWAECVEAIKEIPIWKPRKSELDQAEQANTTTPSM